MTVSDFQPLIRIGLYILAGWLSAHGLPPQAVAILSTDPAMIELASQLAAALVASVSLVWWRIAKRIGGAT
ncbi:hypothetical protein [Roseovarius sp.]